MVPAFLSSNTLRAIGATLAVLGSWLAAADATPASGGQLEQTVSSGAAASTATFRGVVCFASAERNEFFLQDETAALRVHPGIKPDFEPGVGQLIEAEGTLVSGPGGGQLTATRIQLLGEAPLPSPLRVSYEQMAAGQVDCRYCQFAGVVHAVDESRLDGLLGLEIAEERGRVMALLNNYHLGDCRSLIDAEIRVTGVCRRGPDPGQRHNSIQLFVSGMGGIAVIRPGPIDPFSVPSRSLLFLSQPGSPLLHRVKFGGTVSLHQRGRCFYLENESGGLRVETRQPTGLRRGDIVEVLGFASNARPMPPVLEHAEFRKIGTRTNFFPLKASARDLQDPACLGRWLAVDGLTVGPRGQAKLIVGKLRLTLDFLSEPPPPSFLANTRVNARGVLVRDVEGQLGLLVGSASDIQKLRRATREVPLMIGGVLLVTLLLAIAALWRKARNSAVILR